MKLALIESAEIASPGSAINPRGEVVTIVAYTAKNKNPSMVLLECKTAEQAQALVEYLRPVCGDVK